MSGLAKALLYEIDSTRAGNAVGSKLEVQFNPASLKLAVSNKIEGGKSKGRQARQYIGKSSTELGFDLVFDTADEIGEDGTPRSVRERTAMVEKFVRPKGDPGKKQAVPRVRFHWGDLIVDGIIETLSLDFELFSPGGVPLRAKMHVAIKEQDPKYQYLPAESGSAANQGMAPAAERGGAAGGGGGGAGGAGGGAGGLAGAVGAAAAALGDAAAAADRTAEALGGESLAEMAARLGLDPAAWRALATGVSDPLSLPAGFEVQFPSLPGVPGLASAARTALAGAEKADAGPSAASAGASAAAASAAAESGGGRALAERGGVAAALAAATIAATAQAAARERAAFAAAPAPAPAGGSAAAAAAPPPKLSLALEVDPRATAFGRGVPLRSRVGGAHHERRLVIGGGAPLVPSASLSEAVHPADPTTPPWSRLPPDDAGRALGDRHQATTRPRHPCGCGAHTHSSGGSPCRCT